MLEETEIAELIAKAKKFDLPEWQKTYNKRIAKDLQVHTKGLLFSKVDTLFPNEHPDSKNHCVNTYEPFTKGSIWKAINNLVRIFLNSSFAVSASDSTLENINASTFSGQNLFSFFIEKWMSSTIATDPNGAIAVYPPEYLADHPGDAVRFIQSEQLLHIGEEYVAFISESESEKEYNVNDTVFKREIFFDAKVQTLNGKTYVEETFNKSVVVKFLTKVYHVFHRDFILRFYTDKAGTDQWEIFDYGSPLSAIAAFKVTSVPLQPYINESFVAPFIPFGNLALLQHRNHRAVDLMFSYPRMSEIETPCDNDNCSDGVVPNPEDPSKKMNCARCGASGYITVQSPYKVYKKKIDNGLSDPELQKAILGADPVSFHTPDTGILEYSKESWKEYLALAEEAVFVQQKVETGNVESAKKTELDKEGEYSWVLNVSKALNADLKKTIQAFEDSLNKKRAEVGIEQPLSFAIVTESEAFDALDTMMSSKAPVFIKSQKIENFIHKFISKSSPIIKAIDILKMIDPLVFYSKDEIQSFKSNGVVSVEAWITHVYSYSILMQLYQKDKLLFDKSSDIIIKMIETEIEKLKPAEDLKSAMKNVIEE